MRRVCRPSRSMHGLDIGMGLSTRIATESFQGDFPWYTLEEGAVFYCPVKFKFPGIDVVVVSWKPPGAGKKYFFFQSKSQSRKNTRTPWENSFPDQWSKQFSNEYEIEVHFLWITSDSGSSIKPF